MWQVGIYRKRFQQTNLIDFGLGLPGLIGSQTGIDRLPSKSADLVGLVLDDDVPISWAVGVLLRGGEDESDSLQLRSIKGNKESIISYDGGSEWRLITLTGRS